MTRELYKPPFDHALQRALWPLINIALKLLVLVLAIRGKYPDWLVTPDDPVSPFGSGTTRGASVEKTQVAIYRRFGRYVGDVVWLAWRNCGYGLNYRLKPKWLKANGIRYWALTVEDERTPDAGGKLVDGNWVEETKRVGTVWLRCPDGKWLWETTKKFGPFYVITGFRLSAIASGHREDRARMAAGLPLADRPTHHPNMDARPVRSIRVGRTL